jgi:hypothetical protein
MSQSSTLLPVHQLPEVTRGVPVAVVEIVEPVQLGFGLAEQVGLKAVQRADFGIRPTGRMPRHCLGREVEIAPKLA